MKLCVKKSRLHGSVKIPASKSHTIRAVAIAALARGQSRIQNPLSSGDTDAAVRCYRALGAKIDDSDPQIWKITGMDGKVKAAKDAIDVANSGTSLRIAMGSAALAGPGRASTFTGDEQIRSRPLGPLMHSLRELGAKCESLNNNNKAPVKVSGHLKGGSTAISAVTSQYLSSLLLCTPLADQDTQIQVTLLNEPDYVRMTLDWLDDMGIEYENDDFSLFKVKGAQQYKSFDKSICADFSSATFFLCAAALAAERLTLQGLDFSDSQPDKDVVNYLKAMGADIQIGSREITVNSSELHGTQIDMNKTPDALPAISVTAAFAQGTTKIYNVEQARFKETDRIKCMARELEKLGASVEELQDGLIIKAGNIHSAQLRGWNDHRIVMALSLAGLMLEKGCSIDTAEAVRVTFPEYVKLMQKIGADMKLIEN